MSNLLIMYNDLCVSVCVLGMYVCRGVSHVCIWECVWMGERGCLFFVNVWVGV